jgi:hypothetical protein
MLSPTVCCLEDGAIIRDIPNPVDASLITSPVWHNRILMQRQNIDLTAWTEK